MPPPSGPSQPGNPANPGDRGTAAAGDPSGPSEPIIITGDPEPTSETIYLERTQVWSGPIPPADVLAAYGQIDPDFPNRILRMAEEQAVHRREIERRSLEAEIADAAADRRQKRIGQIFALVIAIVGIAGSVYAAVQGQPTFASVLGGATLVALVIAFITGRRAAEPDEPAA